MSEPALQLARIIGDLNADWEPHPTQRQVLNALFLHCFELVFCENGRKWGKTEVMSYFLWRRAMTIPGSGNYYFAPEQKQAKEIVWASKRMQLFGPQQYVDSINNTEMRITLANGAFIKCDGSDNYDAYRGIEPHSAVYDEFRDFRPEFHQAFEPNFSVYEAQLLVCTTPPEQMDLPPYDSMKLGLELGKDLFNFPSWCNPHIKKSWFIRKRAQLYARDEGDVWEREYGAKRVRGGSNAIFPMFDGPSPEKPHTTQVRPHADVMAEIHRDRKKLVWQVICDPGNATVFCVLFRAMNPFTKKVYRLDEIYETRQAETSTSRIMPRIREKREELYPDAETHGVEWDQLYDEAATWFATEALNSFDEHFTPTQKGTRDIDQGISLLKDQMLYGLTVISDRCINYCREFENYLKDPKTGKPRKDCADHAIDCDRYGNDYAGIDLNPSAEPEPPDPDDLPRYRTPEDDLADDALADGEIDFDF